MKKGTLALAIFVSIFLSASFSSAILSVTSYQSNPEGVLPQYKTATITDWYGLGSTLADIEMVDISPQCLIDCYATLKVTTYATKTDVLNDVTFRKLVGGSLSYVTDTYSPDVLLLQSENYTVDVPTYGYTCPGNCTYESCQTEIDGVNYSSCTDILNGTYQEIRSKDVYKSYDGSSLPSGEYYFKVVAHKSVSEQLDFVPAVLGRSLTGFAWWNSNWNRKQQITFTGTIAVNQSIYVIVPKKTNMNSDYSDIRFVNGLETLEIPYYIDSYNSSEARVMLKMQNNNSIFMYYENALATSQSSLDSFTVLNISTGTVARGGEMVYDYVTVASGATLSTNATGYLNITSTINNIAGTISGLNINAGGVGGEAGPGDVGTSADGGDGGTGLSAGGGGNAIHKTTGGYGAASGGGGGGANIAGGTSDSTSCGFCGGTTANGGIGGGAVGSQIDLLGYSGSGGGGGGAHAPTDISEYASGGAGGSGSGKLIFNSQKTLVSGVITEKGGNGGAGSKTDTAAVLCAGGGGGGSGGTILIASEYINVNTSTLIISEGNGGGNDGSGNYCKSTSGAQGSGGRIKMFYEFEYLNDSTTLTIGTGNYTSTTTELNYPEYSFGLETLLQPITVTLLSPNNGYATNQVTNSFNASVYPASLFAYEVSNATLFVWNQTDSSLFYQSPLTIISGTSEVNVSIPATLTDGTYDWNVYGCGFNATSSFCDYAAANRTITIGSTGPIVNIIYPANDTRLIMFTNSVPIAITINATESSPTLDSCWYNYDGGATTSITCGDNATINFNAGWHTVTYYANDSFSNIGSNSTTFLLSPIILNGQTFENPAYETARTNYTYNLTYDNNTYNAPIVKLIYNGTSYDTTATTSGSEAIYYVEKDVNLVTQPTNYSFYWDINSNSDPQYQYNTTLTNQTVSPINFTICDASNNVPYINYTFMDETTLIYTNGSLTQGSFSYWIASGGGTLKKTYNFISPIAKSNYTFCFSPGSEMIKLDTSLRYYYGTQYPSRTYAAIARLLSNTTTDQILYLLSITDGFTMTLNTVEFSGQNIPGVLVTAEKIDGITFTQIGSGLTDSAGLIAFFINGNFQHRFTFSKDGYNTEVATLNPTGINLYKQVMVRNGGVNGTNGSSNTYTDQFQGITYWILPGPGIISPGSRKFNATALSLQNNLENCRLDIVNNTNTSQVLATASGITNASYCFVPITYTAVNRQNLQGRLYLDTIDTTELTKVATVSWIVENGSISSWNNIGTIFGDLVTLPEFGEGMQSSFSRIMWFFIIATIIAGVFIYFTGIDLSSPGMLAVLIPVVCFFASVGGFFTITTAVASAGPWMAQYGVFMITTALLIGFTIDNFRRQTG